MSYTTGPAFWRSRPAAVPALAWFLDNFTGAAPVAATYFEDTFTAAGAETTYFDDTFTGTGQLSAHSSDSGHAWTTLFSNRLNLSGGLLINAAGLSDRGTVTGNVTPVSNVFTVEWTFDLSSGSHESRMSLWLKHSTPTSNRLNLTVIARTDGQIQFQAIDPSASTVIDETVAGVTGSHVLRLEVTNANFALYYDDAQQGSTASYDLTGEAGRLVSLTQSADNTTGTQLTKLKSDRLRIFAGPTESLSSHTSDSGHSWSDGGQPDNISNFTLSGGALTMADNKNVAAVPSATHGDEIVVDIYVNVTQVVSGDSIGRFEFFVGGASWFELYMEVQGSTTFFNMRDATVVPGGTSVSLANGSHHLQMVIGTNAQEFFLDGVSTLTKTVDMTGYGANRGIKLLLFDDSDVSHAMQFTVESVLVAGADGSGTLATHAPDIGGAYTLGDGSSGALTDMALDGSGSLTFTSEGAGGTYAQSAAAPTTDKWFIEARFTPDTLGSGAGDRFYFDVAAIDASSENWLTEVTLDWSATEYSPNNQWLFGATIIDTSATLLFGDSVVVTGDITEAVPVTLRIEKTPDGVTFKLDDVIKFATAAIPDVEPDAVTFTVSSGTGSGSSGRLDYINAEDDASLVFGGEYPSPEHEATGDLVGGGASVSGTAARANLTVLNDTFTGTSAAIGHVADTGQTWVDGGGGGGIQVSGGFLNVVSNGGSGMVNTTIAALTDYTVRIEWDYLGTGTGQSQAHLGYQFAGGFGDMGMTWQVDADNTLGLILFGINSMTAIDNTNRACSVGSHVFEYTVTPTAQALKFNGVQILTRTHNMGSLITNSTGVSLQIIAPASQPSRIKISRVQISGT